LTAGKQLGAIRSPSNLAPIAIDIPPNELVSGSIQLFRAFPELAKAGGHCIRIAWQISLRTNDGADDATAGVFVITIRDGAI